MKTNSKLVSLIACCIAAIGSLMPWASIKSIFGTIDISGTVGDGQFTLILAFLMLGCCFIAKRGVLVLGMAFAVLGAIISVADIAIVGSKYAGTGFIVTVGYGLYLCVLGFVVAFFAMLAFRKTIEMVVHDEVSINSPFHQSSV